MGAVSGPVIFTRKNFAVTALRSTKHDTKASSLMGVQSMGLTVSRVSHTFLSRLVCTLKYSGCVVGSK